MLRLLRDANGVADQFTEMEWEFDRHWATIELSLVRFQRWQSVWENRQQEIDTALDQLKERLQRENEQLPPSRTLEVFRG